MPANPESETFEQLTRRVRMLSRRLERAENEARDLRRTGFGGGGSGGGGGHADELQRRIDELENSTSWRVTKYLREAKTLSSRARPIAVRLARRSGRGSGAAPAPLAGTPAAAQPLAIASAFNYFSREADEALLQSRLRAVASVLGLDMAQPGDSEVVSPEARLWAAHVSRSSCWLIAVGYLGSLPSDDLVETLIDDVEGRRTELAIARLRALRAESTGQWQVTAPLRILTEPVVDATFAATTALHTGVQRVVRNVVPLWAADGADLAILDPVAHAWRAPTGAERHRLLDWDDSLLGRDPAPGDELPSEVLVPWGTVVVVPELKPKGDLEALRAMASAGANTLGAIVYDLIPVSAAEFVPEGVTASFGTYISMVKYAGRVSAISASAAVEFQAMDAVFQAQGIRGPDVLAHPLPIVPPPAAAESVTESIAALRRDPSLPLVLQVGSIGPHKNQRATLAAATALWADGTAFELIFVAPNSWDSGDFAASIRDQQAAGRAVSAVNGITEEQLWSLYRAAHVVVLPSYVEGYGLPLAEALSVGTPVITSDFGSMAEIAQGNGSLLVKPRDHRALAAALGIVLTDTDEYSRLKSAAEAVVPSSWSRYAESTWAWLVRGENV